MAYNPERFYIGQPNTTATTLYTIPANAKIIIKEIIINNTSTTTQKLSVRIVPVGQTPSKANSVIEDKSVLASDQEVFQCHVVMRAGDFISALQQTTGAVTLTISGVIII